MQEIEDGPEPRTFIGRIESVDRHTSKEKSRYTFIVDAVDERYKPERKEEIASEETRKHFSLIRVMTTARRFLEIAGATDADPDSLVGQWIALSLLQRGFRPGPVAQVSQLSSDGYSQYERLTVSEISLFGEEPTFPPTLSAAGDDRKQKAASLAEQGRQFEARSSFHDRIQLLRSIAMIKPAKLRVLDVGHANFITVLATDKKPVAHFDVGWPVSFNRYTCPKKKPFVVEAPIIVLSHWDWDHLHGYHVWPTLKNKKWIAPVQDLGPGALRIATALRDAGNLFSVPKRKKLPKDLGPSSSFVIGSCDPSHTKSKSKHRNNSGLYLRLVLSGGKKALLPGDADYQSLNWPFPSGPELMVVSHHGAAVDGHIIAPSGAKGAAVVSTGKGNVYRHPCFATIAKHESQGWALSFTSEWKGKMRGDKYLP